MLDVNESLNVLIRQELPVAKSYLTKGKDDALSKARLIGYPVVLKIVSEQAIHKTDVGGVIVGINDDVSLAKAYDELTALSRKHGFSLKGLLVQEQFKGLELIIGIKKDPVFNQVIMFGVGGVMVELLKDVSFRVCPVNKSEAKKMINELKAKELLSGFRGSVPADLDVIADLISRVSRMAVNEKIIEMDLNPVMIKGAKALIVDARISF